MAKPKDKNPGRQKAHPSADSVDLHRLDMPTGEQVLLRPTGSGWWWVRMCQKTRAGKIKVGDWSVTEILEENGVMKDYDPTDGSYVPIEEGQRWWWHEWAGPLTPPGGHTTKLMDTPLKPLKLREPPQACSMQRMVLRIEALEIRIATLERWAGGGGGFRCVCCKNVRPSDWFVYEAFNPETKETIKPLCGSCVQRSAVGGLPWKYQGPFRQNAQNDGIQRQEPRQ